MGLFDFFKKKKGSTLEEMDAENRKFIRNNPETANMQDALMRQASSFMTSGKFEEAITLFEQLAKDYPGSEHLYLSQVGAGNFFLGKYDKALDYYIKAREAGFDEDMSDDNIWEACEAIYNQSKDKAALQKYLQLYPDGSYTKDAKKLLSK